VVVTIEDPRREAALEEVPNSSVAPVEAHCMEPVEPLHPCRELRLRCAHDDVQVVRHERPGEHLPTAASSDLAELAFPRIAIEHVVDDRLLRDAARGDVVDGGCRQVGSASSSHLLRR
jgi:hypothetical protein